jgi:hypothetical protein
MEIIGLQKTSKLVYFRLETQADRTLYVSSQHGRRDYGLKDMA